MIRLSGMTGSGIALAALAAALVAFRPATLVAQQLEIRSAAPVLDFTLDSSLGINPDSLRVIGRGVYYVDVQSGNGDSVAIGDRLEVHYVGMLTDGSRFAAGCPPMGYFEIGGRGRSCDTKGNTRGKHGTRKSKTHRYSSQN